MEGQRRSLVPLHTLWCRAVLRLSCRYHGTSSSEPPKRGRSLRRRRRRWGIGNHLHLPVGPPSHPVCRTRARQGVRQPARRCPRHLASGGSERLLSRIGSRSGPSSALHGTLLQRLRDPATTAGDAISSLWIRRCDCRHTCQCGGQDGSVPIGPDQETPAGARANEGAIRGRDDPGIWGGSVEDGEDHRGSRGVAGVVSRSGRWIGQVRAGQCDHNVDV